MKQQLRAIFAELIKNKHAPIKWVSFAAFALAPLFGGVFVLLIKDNGLQGLSGAFQAKAAMLSFEANWGSYLGLLSQAAGIGGVLIFGFIASWLFGREYTENTAKDLLALPVSRAKILNAKFFYYVAWALTLAVSNLLLGLLIGAALGLEGWSTAVLAESLKIYFVTSLLALLANTPVAFFALWGKGYLVPLGGVIILLVLAQIIAAMGLGIYFPWAIPGIFAGSGGEELKMKLNEMSFAILLITGLLGYWASILWWRYSDQK